MIIDIVGNQSVPKFPYRWELWKTSTRFQSMRADARAGDVGKWSPLVKTRGEAVRFARRKSAIEKSLIEERGQ